MSIDRHSRRPLPLLRAVVLLLPLAIGAGSAGCGRNKSYIPSTGSAHEALEAALTAWQNGHAVGTIDTASPPVQVVDTAWGKGQKLARYEILEEESRSDGNRWFTVRLHLQKPPGTQEVHYVVVGRSPLWVYREKDYKRSYNWEGYK